MFIAASETHDGRGKTFSHSYGEKGAKVIEVGKHTALQVDGPFSADHVLLSLELLLEAIQLFLREDRSYSFPAAAPCARFRRTRQT